MALDLSAKRYGSKKLPKGAEVTGEHISNKIAKNPVPSVSYASGVPVQRNTESEFDVVADSKQRARSHDWSPIAQRYHAETQAKDAEKKLEDYRNSSEYARNRAESIRQQQRAMDQDETQTFSPTSDFAPPTPGTDEKEYALRLKAEAARAEANAAQDAAVTEKNRKATEALSEEEKEILEQYAINQIRDQNLPVEMAGMMPTARQEAAPLINRIGQQRADELAETYMRDQNAQFAADVDAAARKEVNDSMTGYGVVANLESIPANVLSGLPGTVGQLQGWARNTGQYSTLDPNATGTIGQVYSGAVRGQTTENILGEDPTLLNQGLALGYQAVMSTADNIARGFLGGGAVGGAMLAATGSFSQTMADASRAGATPAQAAILATATAGIEAISEKIPLDSLITQVRLGKQPWQTIVKNAFLQADIEATTEEISLLGSLLAEAAVLQEKSGYEQTAMQEILRGKSPTEARAIAAQQVWDEVVNTALVSGLSGGMSSVGAGVAGNVRANMAEAPPTRTTANAEQIRQEAIAEAKRLDEQAQQGQTQTQENPVQAETATTQDSTPTTDTQKQSTAQGQEPGIKGTGAAEVNFSGKPAYNATLSEDNSQADRRDDVRPMELPERDINGGNVSAVTGNVYGSRNTPDDLAAAMEEPVSRGDYSYVRISNDAATERARQEIGRAGDWDAARLNFARDVETGIAGAEISARGALILNHAAEVYQQAKDSGDMQAAARAKKAWLSVLSDVQKLGTNTAQGMQALKIIRNLAPQDKIQFAQMAVQNMVRDMRLNTDIQIDEQLLTEYESATTDQQRDEIIERIQQNVADQIPSTMLDKWNALRYTNMLGNLKTNVRNVAGNVANTAVYRFKDLTGAVLESIADKVSGGKVGRTKSVVVNKQLQKAMEPYYRQVKNAIGSGGKYADNASVSGDFAQGVIDKRRIFKSNAKNETVRKVGNAVFAPMEGYRKATNWMMNNQYSGDEAFGKAAFTHAMAGYLQANGVKNAADIKNAPSDLIDKAVAYAVQEAQETTFHDNSALANVLERLKKDAGIIGEGLLPFTKTPANVLTRAEEYSPLGILNTAIMSAQKVAGNTKLADANGRLGSWAARGQDITGTDIINSLSKTLTGAGIFALGAILKSNGILNGGPDDDEEQAAIDKMNGIQPYSINLPDGTTYTFDWLTPVAMPLFMGAQLMQIAEEKELTFADLEEVFTSLADPMIQMSMMQGINSSLEDIKYSGNNMGQFFMNAAVNYLTQGLTNTLLGQIERSTEENRQTTFINPDSNTPQWMQKALGKASQKIPGWDYQQTDYVDTWGQKQENEGGLLYNLLSPGYSSTKKSDAVTTELDRLSDATGESVFPDAASKTVSYTDKNGNKHDEVRLTEEQYQTLAKTQGQTAKNILDSMIENKNYQAMTDEQKAKAIQEVYAYAKERGEIAAVNNHLGYSSDWMTNLSANSKTAAGQIVNRIMNSELNRTFGNLDSAWDNGFDQNVTNTYSREMETAYDSYSKMSVSAKAQVRKEATGTVAKYIEARENGISHTDFLRAAKNVNDVKGTGKNNSIRDIDRRQAIAETTGLSESQIDIIMKAYMPDYDPNDEDSEKTELKYNYIRQEMDLSPAEYASTYRAHLDQDKKKDKIAAIMELGYDRKTATTLYNIYSSNTKGKKLYMSLYESTS